MTQPPDDRLDQAAKLLGLDLPQACRPGVAANLDLLAHHARLLEDTLSREPKS